MASPWHGTAQLRFASAARGTACGTATGFQGGATAPLKLLRGYRHHDGRLELPILHTAGGLVGGDRLTIHASLEPASRVLLTSVAAQKVYGSIGRSRRRPAGAWTEQTLRFSLAAGADLEWLPQELVLYADGLYEQHCRVELAAGASFLGAEVVRLGRSSAGEGLAAGRWRSRLEIQRQQGERRRWELVERFALGGEALSSEHGLAEQPVMGSLVWAAPDPLPADTLAALLERARADRCGLAGEMAIGALEQGLVARYRGPSSQAARFWFTRLWARIRAVRGLAEPELPRVWPFQEAPFAGGST